MAIGSFPLVRSLSQAGAFYLEFISVYLDKLTLDEVASLVVSSHYYKWSAVHRNIPVHPGDLNCSNCAAGRVGCPLSRDELLQVFWWWPRTGDSRWWAKIPMDGLASTGD